MFFMPTGLLYVRESQKLKFYSIFLLFTILQNSKYRSANLLRNARIFSSKAKREFFFFIY